MVPGAFWYLLHLKRLQRYSTRCVISTSHLQVYKVWITASTSCLYGLVKTIRSAVVTNYELLANVTQTNY